MKLTEAEEKELDLEVKKVVDWNKNHAKKEKKLRPQYAVEIGTDDFGDEELRIFYDEKLVSKYSEYGEPEDKIFSRDLKWIRIELIRAFNLGIDSEKCMNKETIKI